jgi:hypothetical protein
MAVLTDLSANEVSKRCLGSDIPWGLDLTLQGRRECHDCSNEGWDENYDQHSPASVSHAESPSVGVAVQGKVFLSVLLRDRQAFRGFVRVSILLCPPG